MTTLPSLPPSAVALPARRRHEALLRTGADHFVHGHSSVHEAAAPSALPTIGAGAGNKVVQRLCDAAMFATAAAFALPVGELNAPTRRSPYAAFARQSAMYLAHVAFGLTYTEIGRGFRRDRTTAAYACRLVEDGRDDPAIDSVLASLESACAALRRQIAVKVLP